MFGSTMGSLHVDTSNGSWTNDVWQTSGQQQGSSDAPWTRVKVDLGDHAGGNGTKLRLRGVTGNNFASDLAIDNLSVLAIPEVYTLTYDTGGGGSLTGATTQALPYGSSGSSVEAIPNQGYAFSMWTDDSTENPRTDTAIASNLMVSAIFTPIVVESFSDWVLLNGLTGDDAARELPLKKSPALRRPPDREARE